MQEDIVKNADEHEELTQSIPAQDIIAKTSEVQTRKEIKTFMFWLPLMIVLLVTASCILCLKIGIDKENDIENFNKYCNDFNYIHNQILENSNESIRICKSYSDMWNIAIEGGTDINDSILVMKSIYGISAKERIEKKEQIDSFMQQYNNPPNEFNNAYNLLLELYGIYGKLYRYSEEPSGSYKSYTEDIHNLESQYKELSDKIKVIVPKEKDIDGFMGLMKTIKEKLEL